ncbi:hypothetical protein [Streptomyces sp. NPDC048438]|uniref:hypothetical protein n=1 Tax=Streptomyces sp. NPDC048438 TaxID=3365551 RepID=UPI003717FAE2
MPTEAFAGPDAGRAMRATSPRSRRQTRCSAEKYAWSARSLTSTPLWPPAGPDGGHAADERPEGEAFVHVRAGHGDGEGIGQHVQLAALGGRCHQAQPLVSAYTTAVNTATRHTEQPTTLRTSSQRRQQQGGQLSEFIRDQTLRWISTHDRSMPHEHQVT